MKSKHFIYQETQIPGFRKLRRAKDLTQEDVEQLTGIPRWRVSLIERGLVPNADELEKLIEILL